VYECLRKRHNCSVFIRFNLQLRVQVTGSGAISGGSAGILFLDPRATEGPETEGQAGNQLETPRDEEFSERGTIFFTGSNGFSLCRAHISRTKIFLGGTLPSAAPLFTGLLKERLSVYY